jgi:hypothetical protein
MTPDMAVSDWDSWLNLPEVTPPDACALSLGIDPYLLKRLYSPDAMSDGLSTSRRDALARRLHVLRQHLARDALPMNFDLPGNADDVGIKLAEFATWALSLPEPWDMPEQLRRLTCGRRLEFVFFQPV